VSRVEFFDGNKQFIANGTLSGGGGNSVYSITLNGITEADSARQSIYARAIDDRGAVGPMGQARVVVRGAPRVQLQFLFGTPYLGDALLGFQSQYSGGDEITRARYWRDGIEIGTVTTYPFRYTDFVSSTGPHSFEVEITTVWGETARSAVETIAFRDTTLATATLLQPANNATFTSAASPIALSVQSTRGRFAIASVEFYRDGTTLLGQATLTATNNATYTYTYGYSWAGASPGSYSITARVTDDNHNVSVSAPVNITVQAPIVVPQAAPITSPASGSEFPAGQTVTIATAAANAATPPDPTITRIELWRAGTGPNPSPVDTMIASVNGNALTATLTLPSSTGELNLYTVAINAAGGRTRSAVTTLTVRADVTDPRYFVWTNLNSALKAGNKAAAMAFLTPTAQLNYGAAIDLILPQASAIVAGYSPLFLVSDSFDTADFLVARTANGQRLMFLLRFIRMDDGKWKLDEL
jgi:Bacterial Ig domain